MPRAYEDLGLLVFMVEKVGRQTQPFVFQICFHIEPYQGRNAHTMYKNIKYIQEKYGQHPAYYKYRYIRPYIC